MKQKKFVWWREMPTFAGVLIGVFLTAIGGVMMLNVVLKLYVFQFDEPQYMGDFSHKCTYEVGTEILEKDERVKLTLAQKKDCIAAEEAKEKKRYVRNRQENLIDALAMLLVGIPFWVIFNRKRKEDE